MMNGEDSDRRTQPCSDEEIRRNCRVVNTVEECKEVVNTLLENYRIITVGIKGRNIESGGLFSIVLVSTSDGWVFCFDFHTCERLMFDGRLNEIIESPDIVKVIHGSRCFARIMGNVYNICARNVFDTQIAFRLLQSILRNCDVDRVDDVPLDTVVKACGRSMLVSTEWEFCQLLNRCPDIWEVRPLDVKALVMAARNVVCLLPEVYCNLVLLIPERHYCALSRMMKSESSCDSFDNFSRELPIRDQNMQTSRNFLQEIQRQIDEIFLEQETTRDSNLPTSAVLQRMHHQIDDIFQQYNSNPQAGASRH